MGKKDNELLRVVTENHVCTSAQSACGVLAGEWKAFNRGVRVLSLFVHWP